MSTANDFKWVGGFLRRYIATIGPHDWPEDPDDFRCFAEGWVGAFRLSHPPITEAEADAARVRLAGYPPAFKRDHLPAVVKVVLGMRERDATQALVKALDTDPAEARAIAVSRDCPECKGNGMALRKGVWADRSWHATASLYCRCRMGRYRLGKDEDGLREMEPMPYDDLQAFPELWNPTLSHSTWSSRAVPPPSVEGRRWRYLRPGEAPPPSIAQAALGRPVNRPRREWAKGIPDDLPMPKPVPTEPRSEPEPQPVPVVETTEEEFGWI